MFQEQTNYKNISFKNKKVISIPFYGTIWM